MLPYSYLSIQENFVEFKNFFGRKNKGVFGIFLLGRIPKNALTNSRQEGGGPLAVEGACVTFVFRITTTAFPLYKKGDAVWHLLFGFWFIRTSARKPRAQRQRKRT